MPICYRCKKEFTLSGLKDFSLPEIFPNRKIYFCWDCEKTLSLGLEQYLKRG